MDFVLWEGVLRGMIVILCTGCGFQGVSGPRDLSNLPANDLVGVILDFAAPTDLAMSGGNSSNPFYCTQGCASHSPCPGGYSCIDRACYISQTVGNDSYIYQCP